MLHEGCLVLNLDCVANERKHGRRVAAAAAAAAAAAGKVEIRGVLKWGLQMGREKQFLAQIKAPNFCIFKPEALPKPCGGTLHAGKRVALHDCVCNLAPVEGGLRLVKRNGTVPRRPLSAGRRNSGAHQHRNQKGGDAIARERERERDRERERLRERERDGSLITGHGWKIMPLATI